MDRREFLKQVCLWSAGLSLTVPRFRIVPEVLAMERQSPLLVHARGKD